MRVIKLLFSGEIFLVLFLFSAYFKGIFGGQLTILFFLLSLMVAIFRIWKHKRIDKALVLPLGVFLTFLGIVAISLLYSKGIDYAYVKVKSLLFMTSWSFIGGLLLINNYERLDRFIKSIVMVVVFCLLTIPFTEAGNYLQVGRLLGIGVVLILAYQIGKESKLGLFFSFILALISIGVIFDSGARMPLISLGLLVLFLLCRSFKIESGILYVSRTFKTIMSFGIATTILVLIMAWKGLLETIIFRMQVLLDGGGTSSTARVERFQEAFSMWGDNPIFGHGIGSFPLFYNGMDIRDYPHNIFLEVLAELGIIGFLVLIVLFAISFFSVLKYKDSVIQLTVLSGILFTLLNAMVSGDINDNRILFTFLAIGCMLPVIKRKQSSEVTNLAS
ncbi:O-antigen ligase family protein [Halobacillus karajensis]|uniref:O-antigen ligase family protein n=1 Tax=Halobacillus karajensis TaxID=195088 RepID=UPI00045C3870|nr:O-antigen ligase family protein [Halobacillus karajensis]CDQ17937.1 Lipid A core-O-antigen ligase [Halobacillus karajensis]